MSRTPTVVEEHGSFRLIERDGRYAVVERRNDAVYDVHPGRGSDGSPALASAAEASGWTGEADARRLFEALRGRGDGLARTIW